MVEILKASAGSGKTHQLTEKYMRLLFGAKDPHAYRHILAVTFTNKATDEMKRRILGELYRLSTDPAGSDYRRCFIGDFGSDEALAKAAGEVLCNILHDYGAFSVSTIDTFFQKTLKAFSRELGHFAAYQVELDRDSLISESISRVLDSLTGSPEDEKKLRWLTDNAISDIENGRGFYLEKTLVDIARRLRSEQHRAKAEECGLDPDSLYGEETVKKLSEGCDRIVEKFKADMEAAVAEVDAAFNEAGLSEEDTSYRFIALEMARFRSVSQLQPSALAKVSGPGKRFLDFYDDPRLWYSKARAALADRVTQRMTDAIAAYRKTLENSLPVLRTALLLKGQVYGFGLADDINRSFRDILREKNVMSLDDSNTLLKGIIDGTDAPFIYEKTGVRYEHFLLDEFQDTSRIQWDNFRPLLADSDASGFYNLVVGDVKQSIYRWRGSDWDILGREMAGSGMNVSERALQQNWRSSREIIEFNNDFFTYAADLLDRKSGAGGEISAIYADVRQEHVAKNAIPGGVGLHFCADGQTQEDAVLECVREALSQGFRYRDIGILVRGNTEGGEVAAALIAAGVPVVTDDSLRILSSVTVRRLLALLSSIDNPDDSLSAYLAVELDVELPEHYHSLSGLCEDVLRALRAFDEASFDSEILYVQSFMDKVQDFQNQQKDGLHAFLEMMAGDESKISSPSVGDAVRVMTIHKSKGLAFPYVIVPYIEKIDLFRHQRKWCRPSVEGTPLQDVASGIYDVDLSSRSRDTLFDGDYRREMLQQHVDNINIAYVAFTRPKHQLRIIGRMPDSAWLARGGEDTDVSDFGQMLWRYSRTHAMEPKVSKGYVPKDDDGGKYEPMAAGYGSWPLGDRLSFSTDSLDFFSGDGAAGASASNRLRGIVLHDILAQTAGPQSLGAAIGQAVEDGRLSPEEGEDALALLSGAIESVADRGWFPEDGSLVWNETSIIGADGEILRPDRVVERPDGSLAVIDYKFGEHRAAHDAQVRRYAGQFRAMGYPRVDAYLWYVDTGIILEK